MSMLYTLKIRPDGKIGRYKVHMVVKKYTQIYDKIILNFSYCQNDILSSKLCVQSREITLCMILTFELSLV